MSEHRVRFDGVNLIARDVEATITFYRRLGVDIPEMQIWRTDTGAHHTEGVAVGGNAEIEIDSEHLAAAYNEGFRPTSRTLLGFRVDSRQAVDELYRELTTEGHPSRQTPFDAFWGARFAIVADPDGRDVGIMSPSDPNRRSPPPNL